MSLMIEVCWARCLFVVLLFGAVANAQQSASSWSVSFPCGNTPCLATAMNDDGAVAGILSVGGPLFVAFPGGQPIQIASDGWVNAINNTGIVVGYSGFKAFAWLPKSSSLVNLNSIFGWISGTATSINDLGEIIGQGIPPAADPRFAGLNQVNLNQINNAGQITGTYLNANNTRTGFLYTPGLPLVTFSGASPNRLNNTGQVLLLFAQSAQQQGQAASAFSTSLYTPGSGVAPVFDATLSPAGMNDAGSVLGNPTYIFGASSPTLWTSAAGPVPIQAVLPSGNGLTVWNTQAINNHGQILVWISLPPPVKGWTSVILTPASGHTRFEANDIRSGPRGEAKESECQTLTLNGRPVC
jgi:hypothetical protein